MGGKRAATVQALTEMALIVYSRTEFVWLREVSPLIRSRMDATTASIREGDLVGADWFVTFTPQEGGFLDAAGAPREGQPIGLRSNHRV